MISYKQSKILVCRKKGDVDVVNKYRINMGLGGVCEIGSFSSIDKLLPPLGLVVLDKLGSSEGCCDEPWRHMCRFPFNSTKSQYQYIGSVHSDSNLSSKRIVWGWVGLQGGRERSSQISAIL